MTQFNSQQPPPGQPAGPEPVAPGFSLTPSEQPWTGPMTAEDKTMGMLCHLLLALSCLGFIASIVIWSMKKDKSPYVNAQGKEAVNFGITAIAVSMVFMVLQMGQMFLFEFPLIGCIFAPISFLIWAGIVILAIIAGLKANQGIIYRYPANLRLIK